MSNLKDWKIKFLLSPKIHYDTLNSSPDITFDTENSLLNGFEIVIRGLSQEKAEKESRFIATIIKELIIIQSGMAVKVHQTSCNEIGNHYPRAVQASSLHSYGIEGKINKLDLNNSATQRLLKSTPNKDLKFLSDAISLNYLGLYEYSIRESYKITEKAKKTEERFTVLRNEFSHPKLDNFKKFDSCYGEHYFEYKLYDKNKKTFTIDIESNKTQQELGKLATELIEICKDILGLK